MAYSMKSFMNQYMPQQEATQYQEPLKFPLGSLVKNKGGGSAGITPLNQMPMPWSSEGVGDLPSMVSEATAGKPDVAIQSETPTEPGTPISKGITAITAPFGIVSMASAAAKGISGKDPLAQAINKGLDFLLGTSFSKGDVSINPLGQTTLGFDVGESPNAPSGYDTSTTGNTAGVLGDMGPDYGGE